MSTTLHVGKKRDQTLTASDSSVIPLGSVTVTASPFGIVSAAIDPATNKVTLTGVSVGIANVNYTSPGYALSTDSVTVIAAPTIIPTDGPEY